MSIVMKNTNYTHRTRTVHPESIHSASLFPHFVMVQPYSKMDSIHFFPQNATHNVKEKGFLKFCKSFKNEKIT